MCRSACAPSTGGGGGSWVAQRQSFRLVSAVAGGAGITVASSRPLQPGDHARNSYRLLRTPHRSKPAQDPKDQQRFAYPVYVVFLMAPTIKLTFPQAQTCFRVAFIALTLISVPLWLKTVRCVLIHGDLDSGDPDIRQLWGGAGNQVAAVEPGSERNHGGLSGGACEWPVCGCRNPAGHWDLQAAADLAHGLMAHGLGVDRLAAPERLCGWFWSDNGVSWSGSEYILPGWFGAFVKQSLPIVNTHRVRAPCWRS